MIADNNLDYYAVSNIMQMEQSISDDRDGEILSSLIAIQEVPAILALCV
jgi:hypothetical protein